MIYLDNAATTRLDGETFEIMKPYLTDLYGNSQSQHSAGRAGGNAVQAARDITASTCGCGADEIIFLSGGTEACNTALKGVCAARKKGKIVLSAIEHPALIESAEQMKNFGFEVAYIKPDVGGEVKPAELKKALTDDVIFCGVMAANNETGVIQPVEEIGKLCRERGVFYFSDCVQSAAYLPLPVAHADACGFSAHKFYGPKGAGALYLKKGSKFTPLMSGGMQERGLRGGTCNVAAIVGMADAYARAVKDRELIFKRVEKIRNRFLDRVLTEIAGARLNGKREKMLPSHANISFDGCEGENIIFYLDLRGVCASTGAACSAGATSPSKTLTAMGFDKARVKSSVRFTFGKRNTEKECDEAVEILKAAVAKIRG